MSAPAKIHVPFIYGRLSLILLIIVLAVLAWVSRLLWVGTDLSERAGNTLTPTTLQVLEQVPADLRIMIFINTDDPRRRTLQRLMQRYQQAKDNLAVFFLNPDLYRLNMEEFNAAPGGEMILEYEQHQERTQVFTEYAITNALFRLATAEQQHIVFLQGHGERQLDGNSGRDINLFARQALDNGFRLQGWDFAKTPQIPENTTLLVIAGPQTSYPPAHVRALLDYVNNGGQLLWFHDPGSYHGMEPLTDEMGFSFIPGVVVDLSAVKLSRDPTVLYLEQLSPHPVTDALDFVQLAGAQAMELDTTLAWENEVILTTNPGTWSELGDTAVPYFDEDAETAGPLVVAAGFFRERATENPIDKGPTLSGAVEQRVVVFGDGDFLSNYYLHPNNMRLGLQLLQWFSESEALLLWEEPRDQQWQLELSEQAFNRLSWLHLVVIPGVVILCGVLIWYLRYRRVA